MSLSPFGNTRYKSRVGSRPALQEATLRDFSAGLNLVDSDTSLRTNSSVVLKNMHRDPDGGMVLRWGTKYKWKVNPTVTGNIVEIVDFRGKLLCFTSTGQIAKVDPTTGVVTAIWNSTIAAALPGAPSGWNATVDLIDYTDFKNQLIVCNGEDKPILISSSYAVTYLQDIPTGSNIFTPVGKFCTTVGNYTVIAGLPASPNDIYISAAGASGTWPGDAAPNDAISINVATYAPEANSDIRGISSFRNFLLVHFAGLTVPLQLGTYDADGNHSPTVSDVIPDYGLLSHRFVQPLAQEVVFADERGAYSAKRNLFGQALEGRFLSDKITPGWATATVDDSGGSGWVITKDSFAIYNRIDQRIMFFFKVGTRTSCYVFSFIENLKKPAWSEVTGMDFDAGTTAVDNRIYFTKADRIYQYGNDIFVDEDYRGDLMALVDGAWTTTTAYVVGDTVSQGGEYYICVEDHTSGTFATDFADEKWEIYYGVPIEFDWELPWSDINARVSKKKVAFIHFDTSGANTFNCALFVDKRYQNALTEELTPAVEIEFVGGDAEGFGGNPYQNFGGGRRTADERLFGMPLEFKLVKFKITGEGTGGLKFETISILYTKGGYHR